MQLSEINTLLEKNKAEVNNNIYNITLHRFNYKTFCIELYRIKLECLNKPNIWLTIPYKYFDKKRTNNDIISEVKLRIDIANHMKLITN